MIKFHFLIITSTKILGKNYVYFLIFLLIFIKFINRHIKRTDCFSNELLILYEIEVTMYINIY